MRKWPRLLIAGLIVGLLGLYPLLAPPAHRIDQAHRDLIVSGMTRQEVESIFGVPAGEYDWAERQESTALLSYKLALQRYVQKIHYVTLEKSVLPGVIHAERYARTPRTSAVWTSRNGSFTVRLDADGRVASTDARAEVRIVPPWSKWWKNWFGGE